MRASAVHHHAQLARELIIFRDGAEWIWKLVAEHCPKAIQILDWLHATEYLMPVAKMDFPTEEVRDVGLNRTKHALWDGMTEKAIATCPNLVRKENSSDPALVTARYFDQNKTACTTQLIVAKVTRSALARSRVQSIKLARYA